MNEQQHQILSILARVIDRPVEEIKPEHVELLHRDRRVQGGAADPWEHPPQPPERRDRPGCARGASRGASRTPGGAAPGSVITKVYQR